MEEFKELRKKYGMTQAQFAEVTGVPLRTVQNWEGGHRACPPYVLELIKFKLRTIFG